MLITEIVNPLSFAHAVSKQFPKSPELICVWLTIFSDDEAPDKPMKLVGKHTVSAWGKEAGLELEDVKTLLRHEDIATTSNVYGDLGMDAKRRIQHRLVEFVKRQAVDESAKRTVAWQQTTPITIQ
jgi:hypothetical protein